MGLKGGKGGDGGAGQARADEQARQERIREGTGKINASFDGQFTPEFFDKRKTAFLDYATPQLNDQYTRAQKDLAFSLDRSGMLNSSVRAEKEAELQKLYDVNRQSVADQALGYGNTAKNNIEDARANLIQTLNATGDADGAAKSAISRAQALSAPDTYSPLANLFGSFTSTLGQQAAIEKAAALANSINSGGSTSLFNTSKKSVVSSS